MTCHQGSVFYLKDRFCLLLVNLMLNLNGTGKGAYDEPNFIYHLRKTFIVEGVDETLMYFLPLKKKDKKDYLTKNLSSPTVFKQSMLSLSVILT